jgi:hypothetical protein
LSAAPRIVNTTGFRPKLIRHQWRSNRVMLAAGNSGQGATMQNIVWAPALTLAAGHDLTLTLTTYFLVMAMQ